MEWCHRHLSAEVRKLFQTTGVDDGGPDTLHRLRGTFVTTVLRGGGDLESLREVLGHSVLSVTAGERVPVVLLLEERLDVGSVLLVDLVEDRLHDLRHGEDTGANEVRERD